MKGGRRRIAISVAASAALVMRCGDGFLFVVPTTTPASPICRRRCPRTRCATTVAALGNDYLDSLNDRDEKCDKGGFGGVEDYLKSLSNIGGGVINNNDKKDDELNASSSAGDERVMGLGAFDVRNDYFDSLGDDEENDPESSSSPGNDNTSDDRTSTSPDEGDARDAAAEAAAFLNFDIGPVGTTKTETGGGVNPHDNPLSGAEDMAKEQRAEMAAQRQNYLSTNNDDGRHSPSSGMIGHEGGGATKEEAGGRGAPCPKMLLTQRAVQTFVHICEEEEGDPHSGRWLEEFLGLPNFVNYHGTGAFDASAYPTGDAVLYDIMGRPNEKCTVSVERERRWDAGFEGFEEREIDIRPAILVQRLLPVRERLAHEFDTILELVRIADALIMRSYLDHLHVLASRQHSYGGMKFDRRISAEVLANFTADNLSPRGEEEEGSISGSSLSPSLSFRGNFDLLYGLCTRAAARRLLRDLQSHSATDITASWFERFCSDNIPVHFDGHQPFGRADEFLELLFRAAPSLVLSSGGEPVGWTDPLWIAERIIAVRSEIATEWKDMMREVVKEDQVKLSNDLFRRMMEGAIEEEIAFDGPFGSAGAFE
eukprot:CAMPEP_0181123168 /NCGR_PEP_ID=MMETSP1071-20121207/25737_1 /TAXON_ID=35127 /ORGANISM="Thalassiosira sp., Strain NH16" /LENGTH=596 /DNA_ID=CAMNT_0023208255 /DNA_START=233 /DNA_END=2023 /DNA_ORIENTATION=-